jgi:ATP phosphoribosyltransferase
METVRMALPAGRLEAPSWRWLEQRGWTATGAEGRPYGDGRGRALFCRLASSTPALEVAVVRGRDIPRLLTAGVVDVGIVGRDVVAEAALPLWTTADLGFGACRIVLALPEAVSWDLGRSWRIATRYPRLTRSWMRRRGILGQVVRLAGSVEVAPRLGLADAVVDVVETGATLLANGLRPVETVLESWAVLASRAGEMPGLWASRLGEAEGGEGRALGPA